MNKILDWIYNRLSAENDTFVQVRDLNLEFNYVLNIKALNYPFVIHIFIKKLLKALITLIIFLIFYKYDIQLISENYMIYIKIYLQICFIICIGVIIFNVIRGFYEIIILNKDTNYIGESVLLIIKLITFFVNIGILCWILNLNIELFLQYNILLIIDLVMIVIFWYYRNILDYEIKGEKLNTFLNYPWIMLMIIIICIKLKLLWPFQNFHFGLFITGIALIFDDEEDDEDEEEEDE